MTSGDDGNPQTMEFYKLAVDMADKISGRRATSNSFFLTVQTAFVAVVGLAAPALESRPWWVSSVIAAAGVTISVSWWLQLRSYRDLNKAKFAVILDMESRLSEKVFTNEWKTLKEDPVESWRERYAELGLVERVIPVVFAVLYVALLLGRLLH
ncbi:RipA family octameric membrane protein [Mycobacterium deserti]|uniref:SMODS and SLOG-associating 2TM effector domain-containing protein n=1 Tax=Mycobacterium deserti TaxID=2978347 RepID=A0ABT2M897_9MYCO|nr:hypothetical protein [Mycobacterium deserti]MCT7657640.1 hypothetical protein [Mycobacterium deserti]